MNNKDHAYMTKGAYHTNTMPHMTLSRIHDQGPIVNHAYMTKGAYHTNTMPL